MIDTNIGNKIKCAKRPKRQNRNRLWTSKAKNNFSESGILKRPISQKPTRRLDGIATQ